MQASDRPFLLTSSAAAEEDDDRVWAVESWWQRTGSQRTFTAAPEYAFNPTTSIQFELSRGSGNAKAAEVEFKHLWIRRDKLALDFSVQQLRGGGDKAAGAVIGFAWHDL